jgi:hypothetical protein
LAVVALEVGGLVVGLLAIGFLTQIMDQVLAASMANADATNPPTDPAAAEQVRALTAQIFRGTILAGAVVGLAWVALMLVGTLKRWVWVYWALMVTAGLSLVGIPQQLGQLFGMGFKTAPNAPAIHQPLGLTLAQLTLGLLWLALLAWMIVAYRRHGPWAMRREGAAGRGGASPAS